MHVPSRRLRVRVRGACAPLRTDQLCKILQREEALLALDDDAAWCLPRVDAVRHQHLGLDGP